MYKPLLLSLVFAAFGNPVLASKDAVITDAEIKQIEDQVIRTLEEKKAPPDRYYLAYLLAARALKDINMLDKAEEYFIKARDSEAKLDKSEIYLELCNLAYLKKNSDVTKERVNEARNYFSKNESYKKSIHMDVLDFYEGKKIANKDSPVAKWASRMISENDLKKKIQDKEYAEALQMLNGPSLEKSENLGMQATYDLLRTLNRIPVKDKDYLCKKTMDKYPGSYTYSMLVCAAIVEFNRTQKLSEKTINELQVYFQKHFQHKSYLLDAVKDLVASGGGK